MGKFNLSETEMEIMQLLWNTDKKMIFRDILDHFNLVEGKAWQRQTLRTQLVRLADKGFVVFEKGGEYISYVPMISEEENRHFWVKGFLDDIFDGSVKNFMLALSGGSKLDQKTIDELREFIE